MNSNTPSRKHPHPSDQERNSCLLAHDWPLPIAMEAPKSTKKMTSLSHRLERTARKKGQVGTWPSMVRNRQYGDLDAARSVADDRTTELGDHDINTMVAAFKLVGQDLAAEKTVSAVDQTGRDTRTASRYAGFDFVLAAGAWIDHAPADTDRGWRATDGNRFTSWLALEATEGLSRSGGDAGQQGHRSTAQEQLTEV